MPESTMEREVRGVRLFERRKGAGPPTVVLHGGVDGRGVSWCRHVAMSHQTASQCHFLDVRGVVCRCRGLCLTDVSGFVIWRSCLWIALSRHRRHDQTN